MCVVFPKKNSASLRNLKLDGISGSVHHLLPRTPGTGPRSCLPSTSRPDRSRKFGRNFRLGCYYITKHTWSYWYLRNSRKRQSDPYRSRNKSQKNTQRTPKRKNRCSSSHAFLVPYSLQFSWHCRYCAFFSHLASDSQKNELLSMKMVPFTYWCCIRTGLSIMSLIYDVFPFCHHDHRMSVKLTMTK